jgi:hypothetical protein
MNLPGFIFHTYYQDSDGLKGSNVTSAGTSIHNTQLCNSNNSKCVNATAFARLHLTVTRSHLPNYYFESPLIKVMFPTAYPFKYLKNLFESQQPIANRLNADVKYLYSL